MAEQWIYWLKEVGQEHNKIVGKKCANLGELTKAGFRVPPGFALGVEAYKRFMGETEATDRLLNTPECLQGRSGKCRRHGEIRSTFGRNERGC